MDVKSPYKDFIQQLKQLVDRYPDLITTTLSNIFTTRRIGNKTHGDLAEIAVPEFINQYMHGYHAKHVGKERYRKKICEEDIEIINEISQTKFLVSLKVYGIGDLQLSTDKEFKMFPRLEQEKGDILRRENIRKIFSDPAFSEFSKVNVLALIYDEKKKEKMKYNILAFDYGDVMNNTCRISRVEPGGRRRHPVYIFYDSENNYICEVRYGGATANAEQRGLWTHTKRGIKYFDSITNGWIDYSHNTILVKLFSHALASSSSGHESALEKIKEYIKLLKEKSGLS
jgi:hypothetical protein